MGFNEIRVNKSREDKEVDKLVRGKLGQDIIKTNIKLTDHFVTELQRLLQEQINDADIAHKRLRLPVPDYAPEGKEHYAKSLAKCAQDHFEEHVGEKFRTALAELIHESLMFSYMRYRRQEGFRQSDIDEARPAISDLQQNILRRSILRLNELPHQIIDGVTGKENDENLNPFARTAAEIFNRMVFWSYDHVRVLDFLTKAIQPIIEKTGKYDNADRAAKDYATEASEFIWDNIDGAMQIMTLMLVEFSILLSTASLNQRHPEFFSRDQIRQTMLSSGDLKERANSWLEYWFNVLTVKLNKPGRPPKETDADRELVKEKVIGAMLKILDEPEKISQWRVSRLLAIGNYKNRHDRTLYNRLKMLDLTWQDLVREAKDKHRQKRTKN